MDLLRQRETRRWRPAAVRGLAELLRKMLATVVSELIISNIGRLRHF